MERMIWLWICLGLFAACQHKQNTAVHKNAALVYTQEDSVITMRIIKELEEDKKLNIGMLTLKAATCFLDAPYVAHTLETGSEEKMVVNLREMDCTTLVENSLALARTVQHKNPDFDKFVKELEFIRYRQGLREGYASRLHYFSDWIYDNDEKKTVKDISRDIAHILYPNRVNFMSHHPESYKVLMENPELIEVIASREDSITHRMSWYIPKDKVPDYENYYKDGDIIGLTTHIDGLDVSHTGIIFKEGLKVKMIHASSREKKVVVTDETLQDYLSTNKSNSGIMLARPNK
ncbi:MAG: DUF1460 domain-containing protein [Prolixibacteraceae bacterium]|nr:DUF1460 domain-containing protein [Prolixibacteraceae bacterium]